MAGVSTGQGANKLDTELNLVPFIDLLSSLVLFLLLTAVWLQVSAIEASVASKGKSSVSVVEQKKLLVHLLPSGYKLDWPSGGPAPIAFLPKARGEYDYARLGTLLKKSYGGKKGPLVAVSADDQIEYGLVIEAIDSIRSATGQAVALSTN